ncbi:MAG: undecaprenyl-phosphate glucose phosphotransferase [Hydrocarboniphaga sp.]|uniref:undecaprenyl-phosphate glucose phosphotransferase n=1 Tax=Hydrocarboniphaga sp. TaxID=2033016 RepID=UPI00260FCC06|nr:undecaprenyl-phosphate glucose phosphotransferase [Hydrocarboniphaga sp.]MDB5969102.1 undecaprenyl-phosphate glucose phosphotransferase [Hydrocarboniphaga sp.]
MLAPRLNAVPPDGSSLLNTDEPPSRAAATRVFSAAQSATISAFALSCHGALYGAVTYGVLRLIAALMRQPFEAPYQILGLLASMLVYMNLRTINLSLPWRVGRVGSLGNRMIMTWSGIVAVLLFLGYSTQRSEYFSRLVLLVWFVGTPVALFGVNATARFIAGRSVLISGRRAVLINANGSARRFVDNAQRSGVYDVVGYFGERGHDDDRDAFGRLPFLGDAMSAAEYVRMKQVDVVFIFLPKLHGPEARLLLDDLGDTTASIYYVPQLEVFDDIQTRMITVESMPMLEVVETPFYGADGLLKRLFDFGSALLAVLLLSPLLASIALAVSLSSPGPVIFRQKRYGLNGRSFSIYKFRTMTVQHGTDTMAEVVQASRGDMRVTPLGRFLRSTSLDELPQLYNVLRGDMSLVGPRPHAVSHNEFYRKAVRGYMLRHKVKPGLTGLAQVNGCRGETVQLGLMAERVRWDLEYIRKWSPLLDLIILLKTVALVLKRHNAY